MRKIIAALNMSLDGYCDHTIGLPDEEIHQHYTRLLGKGDAILYGRTTYELMEFWRTVLDNPSDEASMNDFARAIDALPKIVFSRTLKKVDWKTARLADRDLADEVAALRQDSGKPVFVGSRSLIVQLLNAGLVDELQLCIYPVAAGGGLPLFSSLTGALNFKLTNTRAFTGGAVLLYYRPLEHPANRGGEQP